MGRGLCIEGGAMSEEPISRCTLSNNKAIHQKGCIYILASCTPVFERGMMVLAKTAFFIVALECPAESSSVPNYLQLEQQCSIAPAFHQIADLSADPRTSHDDYEYNDT